MMGAFNGLRGVSLSWVDGSGTTLIQNHQVARAFIFLRSHAPTLRTLSLETQHRLFLHFSINRFGHTFSSLESLDIRSVPAMQPSGDIHVGPSFLPTYEGVEDWPPTSIRHLALVGPTWRLKFKDGTIASPTLAPADLPSLVSLELGPTTPSMTWDLLSSPLLKTLKLHRHGNQPTLPDPTLAPSAPTLSVLSLLSSPALTTRLLDLALTHSTFFPSLTSLNLHGASLSSVYLAHFSSERSPNLVELRLSHTLAVNPDEGLVLPPCASVRILDVSSTLWVRNATVVALAEDMPLLERVNLSACRNVGGKSVVELVRTRGEGGIKEVSLLRCERIDGEAVAELRKWVRGVRHSFPALVEEPRTGRR